ncbi:MAG: methylenetetrahydrofolate reductase [Desulfobulbaceae bacterium]|nr:methylenetetrahydrofolate reductase [Desulfobulbaceae bacterium]
MSSEKNSRFQQSLADPGEFTLTLELVPNRGGRSAAHVRALAFARDAAADGRLQAVSITENAGGHPALAPEVLGREILALGLDVIIHLSGKDKNRNQIESGLFAWDRAGLRNLLVVAGDYQQRGYRGGAKPVFDLDTVHVLDLVGRLNREQPGGDRRNPAVKGLEPSSFYKGVAVSPFKYQEAELALQYFKLQRKIANGADYVITQVGYDARKFQELLLFMRQNQLAVPVLGNVFVPTPGVAGLMNKGKIPGVELPDSYYAKFQEDFADTDGGRKKMLRRAARLLCVLQGLGYAGAHIGGPGLTFKELDYILSEREMVSADWPEFVGEFSCWPEDAFHYYQKAPDGSGLNSAVRTPGAALATSLTYVLSRWFHDQAFKEGGGLYRYLAGMCRRLAGGAGSGVLDRGEYLVKLLLYRCKHCGDCTLPELAFRCPQSGCAKNILNGACGGSRDGWCEVYPGRKKCFYVEVYQRLKKMGLEKTMQEGFVAPRDWSLSETSSWVNFFLTRDHNNRRK